VIEYLEKFKKLPQDIRTKISSPEAIKAITELEETYGVRLASIIMRIMIGEADTSNLASFIAKELNIQEDKAKAIASGLQNRVFASVWDFLEIYKIRGIKDDASAPLSTGTSAPFSSTPLPSADSTSSLQASLSRHKSVGRAKEVASVSTPKGINKTHQIDLRKVQTFKKLPKKVDLSHLLPASSVSDEITVKKSSLVDNKSSFAKASDSASLPQAADKSSFAKASADKVKTLNLKKEEEKDIFFLDKDEIEVKEMAGDIPLKKEYNGDIEKKIEEVVKEVKISFSSEELKKRFKQILVTFLTGVRNRVNTKETIMKEIVNGGLALSDVWADKIINLVNSKKESLGKFGKGEEEKEKVNVRGTDDGTNFVFSNDAILPTKEEVDDFFKNNGSASSPQAGLSTSKDKIGARDVDYSLKKYLKEGKVKLPKELKNKEHITKNKEQRTKNNVLKTEKIVNNKEKKIFKKDSVLGKIKEVPKTEPKIEIRQNISTGKQKMEDIKIPKTMGPIEELLYLDLVAFRRMDTDPSKRTNKIKAKIELLKREGIDKMIEGISAWRMSPVNKIYLQIGKESIEEGRPINKTINARKEKDLNYLDIEEFEAVMDLNRKLRF